MNTNRRHAVAALIAAGLLWGTSVPLSKLALAWLSPGWLTAARFGLAAAVLLAAILLTAGWTSGRAKLRAAFTPKVLAWGVLGYGGSVMVQNAGISRTSVTHAALLIGATPVLVAIIAAVWHRTVARPVAWVGFVVSLLGVGLVTAGGGGGGATMAGDGLVLASLFLGAAATVAQGRLLTGRDPVAVTAVQFLGAAVGALLVTVFMEGAPAVPGGPGPVLAVLALTVGGTVLPFTLFAFGQSRVSAEVAGAFLNLEPLVGAIVGAAAFGDPVGLAQVAGGAAIVAGIGLSSLPLLAGRRRPQAVRLAPATAAAEPVVLAAAEPLVLAAAEPLVLALAEPTALAGAEPLALPAPGWLQTARGWQHVKVTLCPKEALERHVHGIPGCATGGEMGYLWWFIGGSLARAGRVARGRDRDRDTLGRGRAGGGLDAPASAVDRAGVDQPGAGGVAAGQLTIGGGIRLHPLTSSPGDLPDDPGRDPGGEHAVRDDQPRRHRRARRDQGAATYARAVEHRGAVAHQRFGTDDRAVDDAQVTDGRAPADLGHRVVAPVQHRPVLDVRSAAHDDRPEIGPQHRPVPDGGFGLDPDVADQGGSGRDPRPGADVRLAAFKGE